MVVVVAVALFILCKAVTTPTIAVATNINGLAFIAVVRATKAILTFGSMLKTAPKPIDNLPMIINNGPMPATAAVNNIIVF